MREYWDGYQAGRDIEELPNAARPLERMVPTPLSSARVSRPTDSLAENLGSSDPFVQLRAPKPNEVLPMAGEGRDAAESATLEYSTVRRRWEVLPVAVQARPLPSARASRPTRERGEEVALPEPSQVAGESAAAEARADVGAGEIALPELPRGVSGSAAAEEAVVAQTVVRIGEVALSGPPRPVEGAAAAEEGVEVRTLVRSGEVILSEATRADDRLAIAEEGAIATTIVRTGGITLTGGPQAVGEPDDVFVEERFRARSFSPPDR